MTTILHVSILRKQKCRSPTVRVGISLTPNRSVTIDGDRLYIISGYDRLSCLNAETGAIRSKMSTKSIRANSIPGARRAPGTDNLAYIT